MQQVSLRNGIDIKVYNPRELKAHLDKYIIGQDDAKISISVAVFNHYSRLFVNSITDDLKVGKSNVIMAGPTGCGKTAIVKCIADFMGVPYYIADATTITQAGYVGDDVESILVGLLRAANGDLELAQCGIVFIDEIDKLAKRTSNVNITRDVVGEGVQQALLKMVEGAVIGVPPMEGRKHPDMQLTYMDTSNILFVGSGAFPGIENIIRKRISNRSIGYVTKTSPTDALSDDELLEYMSQDDLKDFGMIPEFVGRFPVITTLSKLSKDDLIHILTKPDDSIIKQYTALFAIDGKKLYFGKETLNLIATVADEIGTGARALRSVLESVMREYVFEFGGNDSITEVKIEVDDAKRLLSKRYSKYMKEYA